MKIHQILEVPLNIKVSLQPGNVYEADINRELSIDTKNLIHEICKQPSLYAIWGTMSELARRRVEKSFNHFFNVKPVEERFSKEVQKYIASCKQYELLEQTSQAFSYKKIALLQLWDNPELEEEILQEYYNNLSNLRALARSLYQEVA